MSEDKRARLDFAETGPLPFIHARLSRAPAALVRLRGLLLRHRRRLRQDWSSRRRSLLCCLLVIRA